MRAGIVVLVFTYGLFVPSLNGQQSANDTTPAVVVQRFVDAANARDLDAMIATLAPKAAFRALPTGTSIATGRDSVRAYYDRLFQRTPPEFRVHVASRISDGAFVVDFELFTGTSATMSRQATWIYHVTHGAIQNAWVLRPPPAAGQ